MGSFPALATDSGHQRSSLDLVVSRCCLWQEEVKD